MITTNRFEIQQHLLHAKSQIDSGEQLWFLHKLVTHHHRDYTAFSANWRRQEAALSRIEKLFAGDRHSTILLLASCKHMAASGKKNQDTRRGQTRTEVKIHIRNISCQLQEIAANFHVLKNIKGEQLDTIKQGWL